jgi:A-factor biosynthesis hotdog domain
MTANETIGRATRTALSFEQTVPRAIAHRRAVGEVFVTDSEQTGPEQFLLAWQIPRAHSLWGDRTVPFHDPFSIAEAARQGCFVVVHRHLDIPLDLPFTLRRFTFQAAEDLRVYRDDEHSPLQGLLRYRITRRESHGGELGSMTLEGDLEIGGAPAMAMSGDVVFLSRGDYEALRAFQRSRKPLAGLSAPRPADPVDPALVGRRDVRNIVVGAPRPAGKPGGPTRYPLIVDRSHPSYFDHDYDHVPGPFIVEGFRQTALLAARDAGLPVPPAAAMTGLETTFADFGEFEAPLHYEAAPAAGPGGRAVVRVGLHQFGAQLAEAAIELTPWP